LRSRAAAEAKFGRTRALLPDWHDELAMRPVTCAGLFAEASAGRPGFRQASRPAVSHPGRCVSHRARRLIAAPRQPVEKFYNSRRVNQKTSKNH
jgi:hypothetical protein